MISYILRFIRQARLNRLRRQLRDAGCTYVDQLSDQDLCEALVDLEDKEMRQSGLVAHGLGPWLMAVIPGPWDCGEEA